ncbi:ABC transporter permease [Nonomuraea jiangxiensis]|uniref:Peptide/nickel transport system permease protein n=1 Tax=Nonomuraea jiangxiensis TaxID=633440 RepID=A0A1G9N585_9ACTN|nr:ABC transporter permease [Nonomuraea jiangxiensis]SDL81702.1 peptide/nickel transport system permease protein [Nonomuraea jiangxiensis]
MKRPGPGLWLAVAVLAVLVLAAVAPHLLSAQDPLAVDSAQTLRPPSAAHPLGTDENGRDVLARIVYGTRTSLLLGFGAIAIALVFGGLLGLAAGLGNRVVENVIMRLSDIGLAFPELLLALVVITVAGGGTANAVLAIGVANIPGYARLVRAQTLAVRRSSYVEAAHALGLPGRRVILRHVLPNAVKPVLVLATIGVGTALVAGSALSFLGLGTPPPEPEWGSMLSTARNFISRAWWYGVFPGAAITLTVISVTVVGRALRLRSEGRTSW